MPPSWGGLAYNRTDRVLPKVLGGSVYLGLFLEAGNAWRSRSDIRYGEGHAISQTHHFPFGTNRTRRIPGAALSAMEWPLPRDKFCFEMSTERGTLRGPYWNDRDRPFREVGKRQLSGMRMTRPISQYRYAGSFSFRNIAL